MGKIPRSFAHNSKLADEFELWDNSSSAPRLAAEKRADGATIVHDPAFLARHGFNA